MWIIAYLLHPARLHPLPIAVVWQSMADLPILQVQGGQPSQNVDFGVAVLDEGQPTPEVP